MISALGLLGVDGMAAAVGAVDTILKVVNVRLLSHKVLDPGRLTLVAEGDPAACHAVLDAGSVVVARTGRVISRKEIDRPDDDARWLIGGFRRQPKRPEQKSETKTEVKPEKTQDAPVTSESSAQLLTPLTSVRQGVTAEGVTAHFGWSLDEARNALEQLFSNGALRKRNSRYRLKN